MHIFCKWLLAKGDGQFHPRKAKPLGLKTPARINGSLSGDARLASSFSFHPGLSLFSRPSCVEQRGDAHEEGSWARRRISLGATDPIMRAKHFSFCIFLPALPPPLQQRPALSTSRSEHRRRGERDGGAHRTKPKHIANHLSSSSSTCFTYRNYNKTELEKVTAWRNVTENNPGTHMTMSNESIQRTCPHCHMCTCQEQLTTQFTQTCLRWVPKNMLLLNQLSVIPHKANPPPNSIFTCCRAKCNSAIVIIYLILRLDVKPN